METLDSKRITKLMTLKSIYDGDCIAAFDESGVEYRIPVSTILQSFKYEYPVFLVTKQRKHTYLDGVVEQTKKCEICEQAIKEKIYYACTGWSVEDVKTIDENITDEEATQFLEEYAEHIVESMIADGWETIHYLWDEYTDTKKEKEERG